MSNERYRRAIRLAIADIDPADPKVEANDLIDRLVVKGGLSRPEALRMLAEYAREYGVVYGEDKKTPISRDKVLEHARDLEQEAEAAERPPS